MVLGLSANTKKGSSSCSWHFPIYKVCLLSVTPKKGLSLMQAYLRKYAQSISLHLSLKKTEFIWWHCPFDMISPRGILIEELPPLVIVRLLDGHAHRRIPDALSRRQVGKHMLLKYRYIFKQELRTTGKVQKHSPVARLANICSWNIGIYLNKKWGLRVKYRITLPSPGWRTYAPEI